MADKIGEQNDGQRSENNQKQPNPIKKMDTHQICVTE